MFAHIGGNTCQIDDKLHCNRGCGYFLNICPNVVPIIEFFNLMLKIDDFQSS